MNFATMDPANRLILIIAIVAALIERTITLWEWISRSHQERHDEMAAPLAQHNPPNRFVHDDCRADGETVERKVGYQISQVPGFSVLRSEP